MLWRDSVVEAVARVFGGANPAEGVEHALSVEEAVRELLEEPEYRGGWAGDDEVLIAGALLHDVGFAGREPQWCPDCVEHLDSGVRIGREILAQSQAFEGESNRLESVLSLIAHHDDTTYAFPSKTRGGAPAAAGHGDACSDTPPELQLLREADAILHTGEDHITHSITAWRRQEVPWFGKSGPRLASWMWGECVAANIRLCARRAIVDSSTESGQRLAMQAYERLEDLIRRACESSTVSYQPEICTPLLREASVKRMGCRSFDLEIMAFHSWDALEAELRGCPLKYDSSIHPYDDARIRSEILEKESLTPTALYVLEDRIEEVLELHDALMIRYCFGLWDLPGWLQFTYNSPKKQDIAPPLIEEYDEGKAFSAPKHILAIVDGLHRYHAAEDTGVDRIRVLVASEVGYPLVPLPVEWDEVKRVRKRHYRYNSLDEFLEECPHAQAESEMEITEKNYQYWYYRDLSAFGSRGKRTFREFEELRAD